MNPTRARAALIFFIYALALPPAALPSEVQAADTSLDQARELRRAGRYDDAIRLLQPRAGSDMEAGLLLGKLYLDTDRYNDAIRLYEELCSRGRPENAECWNDLGVTRMALGGYGQATRDFQKSISIQPSARAYSNLALAYAAQRKDGLAREAHENALRLEPRGIVPRLNYAIHLIDHKDYGRARDMLQKVLDADSQQYFARQMMGYSFLREGRYQEAVTEFTLGIEINPRSFDLYYYRAVARYRLRDRSGALADLNRADKIERGNPRADQLRQTLLKSR